MMGEGVEGDGGKGEGNLVGDEVLYCFVGNAHVEGKFFYREDLMVGFLEGFFDGVQQIAAIPFTFTGNTLNIFGIDANTGHPGFHRFDAYKNKVEQTKRKFFGRLSVVP